MIRAAFDDGAKEPFSTQTPLPPPFMSTSVHGRYLPGRAILGSILVHSAVIYYWFSVSVDFTEPKRPPLRVTMVNLKDPN